MKNTSTSKKLATYGAICKALEKLDQDERERVWAAITIVFALEGALQLAKEASK